VVVGGPGHHLGRPADYRSQTWGWAYQILPYVEQTLGLADDAGAGTPTAGDGVVVAGSYIPIYNCRPPHGDQVPVQPGRVGGQAALQ